MGENDKIQKEKEISNLKEQLKESKKDNESKQLLIEEYKAK